MRYNIHSLESFSAKMENVLRSRFDIFASACNAFHNAWYDEVIHDIRVYSRKIQEPLRFLESLAPHSTIAELINECSSIRSRLSAYRDTQVLLQHLINLAADTKSEEQLQMHLQLTAILQQKLDEFNTSSEIATDIGAISGKSKDIEIICLHVRNFQNSNYETYQKLVRKELKKILLKREKNFIRSWKKMKSQKTYHQLHQARIALKKLRYALEFIHELGVMNVSKQIKQYAVLQKNMGLYCDYYLLDGFLNDYLQNNSHPANNQQMHEYIMQISGQCQQHSNQFMKKIFRFNIEDNFVFAK